MEKIKEDTIINISSETLDSKINNIRLLVVKKKVDDYREIYKYSIEYIQDSDNENIIDIDKGITIYNYYKRLYNGYKIYDNESSLLQTKIIEENLENEKELIVENSKIIYNIIKERGWNQDYYLVYLV